MQTVNGTIRAAIIMLNPSPRACIAAPEAAFIERLSDPFIAPTAIAILEPIASILPQMKRSPCHNTTVERRRTSINADATRES
jgi:hypothetical protein